MGERITVNQRKTDGDKSHVPPRLSKSSTPAAYDSPFSGILHLQQTIGNREVTRLIRTGAIQASLKIGQPGDIYEKEADRVAEQVMRMRMPETGCPECEEQVEGVQRQVEEEEEEKIQTKPLADQITPLVQRQIPPEEEEEPVQATLMENRQLQRQEEEEEQISRKASGNSSSVSSDIESRIQSMKNGGQPLSESTRAFFEPRFGIDFSHVRVHSDSGAAEISRGINAKAFTSGKDIVFGHGQYSPGTSGGRRLLAHELTHVVQQDRRASISSFTNRIPVCRTSTGPVIAREVDIDETAANLDKENKKPINMRETEAAAIGTEALRTLGYEEIIELAVNAGFLEREQPGAGEISLHRQLLSPQAEIFRQTGAEALTFGARFAPYAIAAGVSSQLDSPLPGPGDLIALGILAVGLAAAGYGVYMASHGRGNVVDTGIMQEVNEMIAAGLAATVCAALAILMNAAQTAGDSARIKRIKATQKAKGCRHSRNL